MLLDVFNAAQLFTLLTPMARRMLGLVVMMGGAAAMRTVDTFAALSSALREEEVVVLAKDVVVEGTLFVSHLNLSLSGPSTLDGEGLTQLVVVTGESDVLFEDLEFRGGYSPGSGGALSILGGATVELVRCTITASQADVGGAVYVSSSILSIQESVLSTNTARSGAGIYASDSTVTIADSTIAMNIATSSSFDDGGAFVFLRSHGDFKTTTFEKNHAGRGAAVAARATVLTAFECIFRHNKVTTTSEEATTPAMGGAIALASDSTCGLTKSIFHDQHADNGGAVFSSKSTLATFGCTFSRNNAQIGGAIALDDDADWSDAGSNIVDNTADMEGGGAYFAKGCTFLSKRTHFATNSPDQTFAFQSIPVSPKAGLRQRRRLLLTPDSVSSSSSDRFLRHVSSLRLDSPPAIPPAPIIGITSHIVILILLVSSAVSAVFLRRKKTKVPLASPSRFTEVTF